MQNIKEAPIGVFDSGVGGLTVVREIMRQIPQERIVYFGDTARVPYGSKSTDTLIHYTRQIIRFLKTRGVKAIVVACNTASAVALEAIRDEIDLPIIGVVRPGARVAAEATENSKIGVIGTEATVHSRVYEKFIQEILPDAEVIGKACPLFVPLVEEGWTKDPVTREIAGRYLAELQKSEIDTLILGCTHYPLLRHMVGDIMGDQVTLVNPAYETAVELRSLLERLDIANDKDHQNFENPYEFFVSDLADKFKVFANSILPCDVTSIKKINIEEY